MTPLRWMMSGDTGISSETILSVMTDTPMSGHFGPDVPYDPSDFGRCYRLLNHFPEWKSRLHEVCEKHPKWKPLIDCWGELTELYEREIKSKSGRAPLLYARMKELLGR